MNEREVIKMLVEALGHGIRGKEDLWFGPNGVRAISAALAAARALPECQGEPIGELRVVASNHPDATFGVEYDIVATGDQHERLKQLDGAQLYTTPQPIPAVHSKTIAYYTTNDEGDPAMLFFSIDEARKYCDEFESPRELIDKQSIPADVVREAFNKWCKFDSLNMNLREWQNFCAEYKNHQPSLDALRDFATRIERATIERCVQECQQQKDECGTDTSYWYGAKWCEESIRALPTGQIDINGFIK